MSENRQSPRPSNESESHDTFVGSLLANRYYIEARVAKGGTAVVYRARDQTLDREVAVKILHEHLEHRQEVVKRLQREAKVIAQIRHPNILTVYDFLDIGGRAVLVVEYMPGETLSQVVQAPDDIPEEIVLMLAHSILLGLQAAHELEITHRDIKPANVLVHPSLGVKISDFGLAKILDSDDALTKAGVFIGTPSFSSPEQIEGKPLDHRSDIFSLGLTIYMMATKSHAFKNKGDSMSQVWFKTVKGNFEAARLRNPKVSKELDRIIAKALQVDMAKRYATAREMAEEIEALLRNRGLLPYQALLKSFLASPLTYVPREKRARSLRLRIIGACLVLAGMLTAYSWYKERRAPVVTGQAPVVSPSAQESLVKGVSPEMSAKVSEVPKPAPKASPALPKEIPSESPPEEAKKLLPKPAITSPAVEFKAEPPSFLERRDAVALSGKERLIISEELSDLSIKIEWKGDARNFSLLREGQTKALESGKSPKNYWMTKHLMPGRYMWKAGESGGLFEVISLSQYRDAIDKAKKILVVTSQFADADAEMNPWLQQLRFSWASGPAAAAYKLEIATDAAFSQIIYSASSTTKFLSVERKWRDKEILYWRISYLDEQKNTFFVDRARRLNLILKGSPPSTIIEKNHLDQWQIFPTPHQDVKCQFWGDKGALSEVGLIPGSGSSLSPLKRDYTALLCSDASSLYILK